MSLNINQLEKVRNLAGGRVEARCPACAESGNDRKGEHLLIKPDGRFGCCAYPKDREHRKRIFALVGDNSRKSIEVRPARVKVVGPIRSGILGRLGRVFPSPIVNEIADASDGVFEVDEDFDEVRTPRTPVEKSEQSGTEQSRTLRTPLNPNRWEENDNCTYIKRVGVGASEASELNLEQKTAGVGVEDAQDWRERHPDAEIDENGRPLPYVKANGTLVIPFDSDERFHYWKGGQSLALTKEEAISRKEKNHHGVGV